MLSLFLVSYKHSKNKDVLSVSFLCLVTREGGRGCFLQCLWNISPWWLFGSEQLVIRVVQRLVTGN